MLRGGAGGNRTHDLLNAMPTGNHNTFKFNIISKKFKGAA
jgi:hypothetical protein